MNITRFLYNISMTDGHVTNTQIEKLYRMKTNPLGHTLTKRRKKGTSARLKIIAGWKTFMPIIIREAEKEKEKRQNNKSMISLDKYQEQLTTSMWIDRGEKKNLPDHL